MKLILIPPYGVTVDVQPNYSDREIAANMEKKGQLDGVEIDFDEGYPFPAEIDPANRTEEFLAYIGVGVVKKVREYSEMGKYDAIVQTGDLEPGFFAARVVSKIPFVSATHSALHVASLIGERFAILVLHDRAAGMVRRFVQSCGFSHKAVSVRYPSHPSGYIARFIREYKKEERARLPEVKKVVGEMATQCIAAIEKDRVDSIIIGCPGHQVFEDEVRQELDRAGYHEIPIICTLPAAVEMAKVMVSMKLTQAARAYPGDDLRAKPEFR